MSLSQTREAAKRTADIAVTLLADRDLSYHSPAPPAPTPSREVQGLSAAQLRDSSFDTIQDAIDALTIETALIDERGKEVLASQSWRLRKESNRPATSSRAGWRAGPLGFLSDNAGDAQSIANALQNILSGRREIEKYEFATQNDKLRGHFQVTITPIRLAATRAALVVNEDVTEVHDLHIKARSLANELLHAEEIERRRIAREMHDSTAQDLIAISLNLKRLAPLATDDSSRDALNEIQGILSHTQQDVRTMSYLLHPPFVEDGGLFVALGALTHGLSRRMGIPIDLECSEAEPRLPIDDEFALYRVAQEALMNVHRHASATCVVVRYKREGEFAVLTVEDDGVGFGGRYGRHVNSGVGILGMRARLEQLGGTIRLSRLDRGTTLRAILPLRRAG